jgi:hypothetical protein
MPGSQVPPGCRGPAGPRKPSPGAVVGRKLPPGVAHWGFAREIWFAGFCHAGIYAPYFSTKLLGHTSRKFDRLTRSGQRGVKPPARRPRCQADVPANWRVNAMRERRSAKHTGRGRFGSHAQQAISCECRPIVVAMASRWRWRASICGTRSAASASQSLRSRRDRASSSVHASSVS